MLPSCQTPTPSLQLYTVCPLRPGGRQLRPILPWRPGGTLLGSASREELSQEGQLADGLQLQRWPGQAPASPPSLGSSVGWSPLPLPAGRGAGAVALAFLAALLGDFTNDLEWCLCSRPAPCKEPGTQQVPCSPPEQTSLCQGPDGGLPCHMNRGPLPMKTGGGSQGQADCSPTGPPSWHL